MEKYFYGFVFACLVVAIISIGLGAILDGLHTRRISGKLRINPALGGALTTLVAVCGVIAGKATSADRPVWGEMTLALFLLWLIVILVFLNIRHSRKCRAGK